MQTTRAGLDRFWTIAVPAAIAVAFPLLLLLTNSRIPFANDFHCDPWHYFGFFFIVDQQQTIDATSRMLSRIPEVWLGRLANDLAPGVFADYLNFFILYSGTNLALYFAVLRFFDGPRALIATAFLGLNTIFIGTLSVTYTGPSVLYNVLGIWLAAEAQRADALKRTLALVATGLALGLSVHGHAYAVECAFAIPLYAVRPERTTPMALLRQLVEIGLKVAAGIILGTIVIGAINWWFFGGKFLFFAYQFEVIANMKTGDYRIGDWFFKACRGAVILLALAIPLLRLAALCRRSVELERGDYQTCIVNVVTLAIGAALLVDNMFGAYFLEYDYYYVMLLPHIAISVASLFAGKRVSARWLGVLAAVYVVIACLSALPSIEAIGRVIASPDNGYFSLSVAGAVLLAAAVAIFTTRDRISRVAIALTLVLLGCWGFTVRPQRMGRLVWEDGSRGVPAYSAGGYGRVREAMAFLSAYHFKSRPVFWVTIEDGIAETIAMPRSFDYCVLEMKLPKLEMTEGSFARDFKAGNEIVLAHRDSTLLDKANEELRSHGLAVDEHARKFISAAGVSYWVVIGTLKAVPASG